MSSFLDSAEFERLLERLAANDPSLTNVNLVGKQLRDAGVRRLSEALQGNTHVTRLDLSWNGIGDDGARALAEMLRTNSTITHLTELSSYVRFLGLLDNDIDEDLFAKVEELVQINNQAPNPEEARRLKIECRIGWLLDSEDGTQYEEAVSLALDELDSFPEAERRRGLFELLLESAEGGVAASGRGMDVASSLDAETSRVLYRYAAECGAAPVVLTNLLRAHPSLCVCRDVKEKLYPFMLLAAMSEAGVCDVMEASPLSPSLAEGGISQPMQNTRSE